MTAVSRHGGDLAALAQAFPSAPQPWLDLSTGLNPWPYPTGDLPGEAFSRLPGRDAMDAARSAMAAAWAVAPERVALLPGSEAGIQLLPRLLPRQTVRIVGPTYGDHARSWRAAGVDVQEVGSLPMEGGGIVVVVNPNNPDGRRIEAGRILKAAARLASRRGTLVVDEAFGDLDPSGSVASSAGQEGLIVLRSFGKFYGLAGVRLGALLGARELVERATEALGSWPVSGPALALAARAYRDVAWAEATRQQLRDAAQALDAVLTAAGLQVEGGTNLFRYVRCEAAHAVWGHLARAGIATRRFEAAPRHLRIGLPPGAAALGRLAAALRSR